MRMIKVRKSLTLFTCKKTTYIGRPLSVSNKVPSHVNRPVAIVQFVVEAAGVADNLTAHIAPPLAGLVDAAVCALDVSRLYLTGAKKKNRLVVKILPLSFSTPPTFRPECDFRPGEAPLPSSQFLSLTTIGSAAMSSAFRFS